MHAASPCLQLAGTGLLQQTQADPAWAVQAPAAIIQQPVQMVLLADQLLFCRCSCAHHSLPACSGGASCTPLSQPTPEVHGLSILLI